MKLSSQWNFTIGFFPCRSFVTLLLSLYLKFPGSSLSYTSSRYLIFNIISRIIQDFSSRAANATLIRYFSILSPNSTKFIFCEYKDLEHLSNEFHDRHWFVYWISGDIMTEGRFACYQNKITKFGAKTYRHIDLFLPDYSIQDLKSDTLTQ